MIDRKITAQVVLETFFTEGEWERLRQLVTRAMVLQVMFGLSTKDACQQAVEEMRLMDADDRAAEAGRLRLVV